MIVNLELIAQLLRESGVTAWTENTGGGCMCVVVYGRPPDYEEIATMGPGVLDGDRELAYTEEGLSISARGQLVRIGADDDETAIATAIKWFVL